MTYPSYPYDIDDLIEKFTEQNKQFKEYKFVKGGEFSTTEALLSMCKEIKYLQDKVSDLQ